MPDLEVKVGSQATSSATPTSHGSDLLSGGNSLARYNRYGGVHVEVLAEVAVAMVDGESSPAGTCAASSVAEIAYCADNGTTRGCIYRSPQHRLIVVAGVLVVGRVARATTSVVGHALGRIPVGMEVDRTADARRVTIVGPFTVSPLKALMIPSPPVVGKSVVLP